MEPKAPFMRIGNSNGLLHRLCGSAPQRPTPRRHATQRDLDMLHRMDEGLHRRLNVHLAQPGIFQTISGQALPC
jgi:hypothetical protein